MSFSARLMVLQHGYESVSNGLDDTWGYLRRILPRHGVHISRRVVEKRAEVPVESYESKGMDWFTACLVKSCSTRDSTSGCPI